ncbi:hypothetical protein RclHR1_12570007 [Rhizophagus clarus]|uniref:Uncharacterized protein n=1 Tax=Rhizophagus clarus TaxID=94130 RepID=A0A2Z6QC93_9GLOM|nr:hypothetical protein RclHR1_12570007 [Rhizophagus clarus]GES91668.1 hypothetical protein RCL_jg13912.t1 [Rhizophagus clarus]
MANQSNKQSYRPWNKLTLGIETEPIEFDDSSSKDNQRPQGPRRNSWSQPSKRGRNVKGKKWYHRKHYNNYYHPRDEDNNCDNRTEDKSYNNNWDDRQFAAAAADDDNPIAKSNPDQIWTPNSDHKNVKSASPPVSSSDITDNFLKNEIIIRLCDLELKAETADVPEIEAPKTYLGVIPTTRLEVEEDLIKFDD